MLRQEGEVFWTESKLVGSVEHHLLRFTMFQHDESNSRLVP